MRGENGSALVEAAIALPCLVLAVMWSAALTDVLLLKLKAAEALRYALWETTVFKAPEQIGTEVQRKFVDLRSARDMRVPFTGLSAYPLATDLAWSAAVDSTSQRADVGGAARIPDAAGVGRWLGTVLSGLSRSVDAEMRREGFNVHGVAVARVGLLRASHDRSSPLLQGGGLLGTDFRASATLRNLRLEAPLRDQRPMQLVFDAWKAWPKPARYSFQGAPGDVSMPPRRTYPAVEEQVAAQVGRIAFFGLSRQPWFRKLRDLGNTVLRFLGPVVGGDLPDVFSTERMDGPSRGPITILPPQVAAEPWVPHLCDAHRREEACATKRLGDLRSSRAATALLDETATLGSGVDRARYTLPFAVQSQYWTASGGTSGGDNTGADRKLAAVPARIATQNEYVKTYACRGHFFAGAQHAQEADAARRYGRSCYR